MEHRIHAGQAKHLFHHRRQVGQIHPTAGFKLLHGSNNGTQPAGINEIHLCEVKNHAGRSAFGFGAHLFLELDRDCRIDPVACHGHDLNVAL